MASARTLQPQDEIAHYRIVGPLGAGGMGEVYLAQDQTLERNVALKILPPELVQSEERVRRFVREAKSASSLNHPNIVTIYEIGQDEVRSSGTGAAREPGSSSLHYISMELVSGDTLAMKIHHEKTDLRTLLGYLAQAAEGLAKAHAAGIVHRDLKPGNIMISKDGFAKVLDFGLAKLTEKAPLDGDVTAGGATQVGEGTSVGAVVGTVGYMSPEQVRGGTVDHRSDIFSFGCILYEAATRSKPFLADSNVETMHKILHDKPKPVEELNKDVPAEVRRVIRRCLAKNPEQRFQSAKDLAIELREIVDEYETLTPSGSSGSGVSTLGPQQPARRRGLSPAAGIGAAAVVLIALVAVVMVARRGHQSSSEAVAPGIKVSTVTTRGRAVGTALSPDGRYLAYSLFMDGQRTLWVRQVATGSDVQILPPQRISPSGLVFTPDGNYLYYQSADPDRDGYTAVFEVPALGGTPQKRAYDVDSRVTFSPDGKQICFRRGEPHKKQEVLVVRTISDGQERVLATAKSPLAFGQPAWSPDGKRVASVEFDGNETFPMSVVCYDVANGKRTPLGKGRWYEASDLIWLPDGKGLVTSVIDPSTYTAGRLLKIAYPGGEVSPISTDLDQYGQLSVSNDGTTLAAIRLRELFNLWTVSTSGDPGLHQITFGSSDGGAVRDFDPAQDSTIYYHAVKDGEVKILTVGSDGRNERTILGGGPYTAQPTFRPGAGLFFVRVDDKNHLHVWRADEHGENPRPVTSGGGEQLSDVSPDGRLVLFIREDNPDVLWSIPASGGQATQLGPSSRNSAQFSPDGRWIGHISVRDVNGQGTFVPEVFPVNGGPRITPPVPPRTEDPLFSPDGTRLDWVHPSDGFKNVWQVRVDGGTPQTITHFTEGRISRHVWSPDGKRLALIRYTGANSAANVWMTDADGGHPVALTDFKTGQISNVKWSRDGRHVYFTYGESSQNVVLIRNIQ